MQAIPVIVFLVAALVSAFSSRTESRIGVDTAKSFSGGCGCLSLLAVITLGVLVYFNKIPPFPYNATIMLILTALGIIIGTIAGILTDPYTGKGVYDFGVSLLTATFFWMTTSYLYSAIFRLALQVSLSSVLIGAVFTAVESIVVYWFSSFLKAA